MHLVGFIIRIYDDARSPERQTYKYVLTSPDRKNVQSDRLLLDARECKMSFKVYFSSQRSFR
jgi:hypothetical protein